MAETYTTTNTVTISLDERAVRRIIAGIERPSTTKANPDEDGTAGVLAVVGAPPSSGSGGIALVVER